jgi:hypothetical protein
MGIASFGQKRDSTLLKKRVVKNPPTLSSDEPKKRTTSKIINDSVKQVYGPSTSTWITEADLFYNKKNYRPLDTAINNFHRWTYVQQFNNRLQDLGNMGTALNPIFPTVPSTIGLTPGFNAYTPYFESAEPRYYDTKSPFTRIYVVWGGSGRAMTHVEFSRNINPRWNFGFNYRPILVEKQIQRQFGVRQTISHYYDFFTTYRSKKERYFLAFNYRRIRHQVRENGGVLVADNATFSSFFDANAKPYWSTAGTEELRQALHFHHHYKLAKPVQVYQTVDYNLQNNLFKISPSDTATHYFRNIQIDSTQNDLVSFNAFQNEVGVKGSAGFLFYDFYYKLRSVQANNDLLKNLDTRHSLSRIENYLGARMAFRLDSLNELKANAELLLDGNYKLEGILNTPWLDASLVSTLAKPGYMQQVYRGIRTLWFNNFNNTFSNQLKGNIKINWGPFYFSPGVTYSIFSNSIYFTSTVDPERPQSDLLLPHQSTGNQQLFSPELTLNVRFLKNLHFRSQTIYTQLWKNDDNVLRVPEWFANAQLTYEKFLFARALQMQLGIEVCYRSAYQALGYAPDIQTFYNQDSKTIGELVVGDIFMNAKIKRGRLFVKYHNYTKLFRPPGYMLTYGYPAVPNVIDFGFELLLFD